jgi:hypothetical protein
MFHVKTIRFTFRMDDKYPFDQELAEHLLQEAKQGFRLDRVFTVQPTVDDVRVVVITTTHTPP